MKYYLSNNASRRVKLGRFVLSFEVVDQFAGAWRGIYATPNPEEIALIADSATRLGLQELTQEEYEALKKKFVTTQILSQKRSGLRPTNTSVGGNKPAVTVADPKARSALGKTLEAKKDLPEASEVLKVGVANISDNLDKPETARRGRRKPE